MLTPQQVIPFLENEDWLVREHAIDYLAKAHDQGSATAEDIWRVWDRFGQHTWRNPLAQLENFRQTDLSLRRALDLLKMGVGEQTGWYLQRGIQRIDLALLDQHRGELLENAHLGTKLREHLKLRLELSEAHLSLDELWGRLMAHGIEAGEATLDKVDLRVSERLIEAILREPGDVPERAVRLLSDPSVQDWREIYAIELLGEARFAPALDVLAAKVEIDADYMRERAIDALVAIGSEAVVQRADTLMVHPEWHVRLFAHDLLERIKLPQSEAAVARLLEVEQDATVLATLGLSACMLVAEPPLLARVRDLYAAGRMAEDFADIPEVLLGAGAMVGYQPPEATRWRGDVERKNQRVAAATQSMLLMAKEFRERWLEGTNSTQAGSDDEAEWSDPDEVSQSARDNVEVTMPIRRTEAKVGRNDPCPCGSGKKYKKCCLTAG